MKKIILLFLFAGSAIQSFSQLYQQLFTTPSSSVANGPVTDPAYVSATPNSSQLTYLATNASGTNTMQVSGGTLQVGISSTGGAWSAVRNEAFAGPPTAMMVRMVANIDVASSGSNPKFFFYVGSSFSNGLAAESNPNIHSGFSLRFGNSAYYFAKTLGNVGTEVTADRIADAVNVAFTFVTNNSGASITYTAPDGSTEALANDTWDLWTDNVKRFDDQVATTSAQTLSNIKFGDLGTSSAGRANWTIDSISISDPLAPLPLTLSALRAVTKNNIIELKWDCCNEVNVAKYNLERSANGISFQTISSIAAKNVTATQQYSLIDATPFAGNNFYRIKSIDKDGRAQYSSIIKVSKSAKAEVAIAPNPVANHQLNVQMNNLTKGTYALRIVSLGGQLVYKNNLEVESGSAVETLQLPGSIKAGSYLLQLTNGTSNYKSNIIIQ